MAEFCLKHYNEMFDANMTEKDVVMEMDFCEGCAEEKPCVISIRRKPLFSELLDKVFHRK